MRDKKEMSDMTDSEISYRKFLKNLGVTTHKELENLIKEKLYICDPWVTENIKNLLRGPKGIFSKNDGPKFG